MKGQHICEWLTLSYMKICGKSCRGLLQSPSCTTVKGFTYRALLEMWSRSYEPNTAVLPVGYMNEKTKLWHHELRAVEREFKR